MGNRGWGSVTLQFLSPETSRVQSGDGDSYFLVSTSGPNLPVDLRVHPTRGTAEYMVYTTLQHLCPRGLRKGGGVHHLKAAFQS